MGLTVCPKDSLPSHLGTEIEVCERLVLAFFQEMAVDLEQGPTAPHGRPPSGGHLLFGVFCRRLQALASGWDVASRLQRQQELLTYKR